MSDHTLLELSRLASQRDLSAAKRLVAEIERGRGPNEDRERAASLLPELYRTSALVRMTIDGSPDGRSAEEILARVVQMQHNFNLAQQARIFRLEQMAPLQIEIPEHLRDIYASDPGNGPR